MGVLEGAALVQWVNAGCVAQGVPFLVSDAGVIAKVCTLLRGSPAGVEGSDAPDPGGDDGMVEDSPNDV
jgi:hypothetical protein